MHYFQALRAVLGPQVPDELRSATRNRRPPLDRFNALLSYGYGLLHTAVMRAVLAVGLEPALGFFHTPRSAAYPLVLDLMELFRVPLWDLVRSRLAESQSMGFGHGLHGDTGEGVAFRCGPQEGDRSVRGPAWRRRGSTRC